MTDSVSFCFVLFLELGKECGMCFYKTLVSHMDLQFPVRRSEDLSI